MSEPEPIDNNTMGRLARALRLNQVDITLDDQEIDEVVAYVGELIPSEGDEDEQR